MSLFIIAILLVVIVLLLLRQFARGVPEGDGRWPLVGRPLLTPREEELFRRLEQLYPQHYVFTQVALSQLLAVKSGTANGQSIRNHFRQLVADFVLCRADLGVIAVIELDDSSHLAPDRREADARKTRAVESAGIRLVRIPAGPLPSIDVLQEMIDAQDGESPIPGSTANAEAAALFGPVLGVVLLGVLVVLGWVGYTQFTTGLVKGLAVPKQIVVSVPAPKAAGPVAQTPVSPAVLQQAEQKRVEAARALAAQQAADELEGRRQAAWSAYYQAPASCAHPPAWADQVECGNQYIRAKKEFEKMWQARINAPASPVEVASTVKN